MLLYVLESKQKAEELKEVDYQPKDGQLTKVAAKIFGKSVVST